MAGRRVIVLLLAGSAGRVGEASLGQIYLTKEVKWWQHGGDHGGP